MLLKYFYDEQLAHASYFVGCQQAGKALIIDPSRKIDPYVQLARQEGMRIEGVVETHIHADYLSGARELAERVGATLYLSDEGDEDWKYQYLADYDHRLLRDGDHFSIGNLLFSTMHTPGHTPESISLLLTDLGGGADVPMGIFTGDFVFVGAVGRPDLLEKAVGVTGSAVTAAEAMFDSLNRFKQLDDYLQVWPAHGAGSACGKGLGAIPSSTVGYEKLFNPALAYEDREQFVTYLLSDQPEPPKYFALMKQLNKEGPPLLGKWGLPKRLELEKIDELLAKNEMIIDIRLSNEFQIGHLAGTINIPAHLLADWAGWLVDYERPIYLIGEPTNLTKAVEMLYKIGIDQIDGYFDQLDFVRNGLNTQAYVSETVTHLSEKIEAGAVYLIDVRSQTEWDSGHIPGAEHIMLGYLPERIQQFGKDKPIVVHCQSGVRSAIAASIIQSAGYLDVINLSGGIFAWLRAELKII